MRSIDGTEIAIREFAAKNLSLIVSPLTDSIFCPPSKLPRYFEFASMPKPEIAKRAIRLGAILEWQFTPVAISVPPNYYMRVHYLILKRIESFHLCLS